MAKGKKSKSKGFVSQGQRKNYSRQTLKSVRRDTTLLDRALNIMVNHGRCIFDERRKREAVDV